MNDIIYFLKDGQNEELRYSLRSVAKNFPHDRVIFYGGCPIGIQPDIYVPIEQNQPSKWQNVRMMIEQACSNDEISENFWLFNDDFFVMRQITDLRPRHQGKIIDHINDVETKHGSATPYTQLLRHQLETIKKFMNPYDALDYALHMPMLINRKKALTMLKAFPNEPMFRSLYGNHQKLGGIQVEDCKFGTIREPKNKDSEFLSTSDEAFIGHDIGEYIRQQFTEPSRWEYGGQL